MKEYHKIQTLFLRDPETKHKTLIDGKYSHEAFEYLAGCQWEWTEKVDGTNIRVMWDGDRVWFGGKTDRAQIPARLVAYLQKKFTPDSMRRVFSQDTSDGGSVPSVCLYGEGYGAGIQKGGGDYSSEQKFVLFDVSIDGWWLRRGDVEDIASKLSIDVVPIVGVGTLHEMVDVVRDGFNSRWGDFKAEGIVARPMVEMYTRAGNRIITKLKTKDFVCVPVA